MKEQLYYENSEGLSEWNIAREFWANRPDGLSAMLRVKNEGDFLDYAVRSIIDWHDEVCLFVQGNQEDRTPLIAARLMTAFPDKVRVFVYPFESVINGPGHDLQPRGSIYERAYFYNWCLSKTRFAFADKWDGDMIAHDWLGEMVRRLMKKHDMVSFKGLDLAGRQLAWRSYQEHTATEPRVFRVSPKTWYFTHTHCEHFAPSVIPACALPNRIVIRDYAYLHLKWCKSALKFSGVGWPEDWMTADPYYAEIYTKKKAARPYGGPYPAAIRPYLDALKAA